MKGIRALLLILLHLACTIAVQALILRLLLGDTQISSGRCVLAVGAALLIAAADAALSCWLLKRTDFSRLGFLALEFWDLFLISPLLLLVIMSFISGKEGIVFGWTALLMDLLLIFGRSTSYVLCDPDRKQKDKSRK